MEMTEYKWDKDQINQLVEQGKAEIVNISYFDRDEYSKMIYEDTINLLKTADPDTIERRKKWGPIGDERCHFRANSSQM